MGIGSKFQKFKDKVFDDIIPNELKSGALEELGLIIDG